MAQPMTDKAAYRIRRHYDTKDKPKKYEATYELFDEQLQRVVVRCDLAGKAVFSTLTFIDEDNATWRMQPNRKFMPSRWCLADERDRVLWQFKQKALAKLVNPIYKTVMVVLDGESRELMRVVDLKAAKVETLLGLGISEYALMRKDTPLAGFKSLPREQPPEGKGFIKAIKRFFSLSDMAIVSMTDSHPLPPPAALAMYLLFNEFTDTSGG